MIDHQLLPPHEKILTKKDQIIHLIARGETAEILNDNELEEAFKELMKYELIDIKQDKILLTALGEEARIIGVKNVIHKAKLNIIVKDIPVKVNVLKNKLLLFPSLIFLLIIFLAVMFLFK